jgi:hypothetical protein
MTYLPASRFWPVQGVESVIFAILALTLAMFTYWWVHPGGQTDVAGPLSGAYGGEADAQSPPHPAC